MKINGLLNPLNFFSLTCVFALGLMTIFGCGGGGEGSGDNIGGENAGLITIDYPTSESSYTEYCNSAHLSGDAFISPTWWRCCTGSAEDTGVTVIWENKTNGESGNASQDVEICNALWSPFLCNHTWDASVPLILGDNLIVVTASDPAGKTGNDSVTVTKPEYTYYISGNVTNADGIALGIFVTDINLHLSGENIEQDGKVSIDGSYGFACIPNGSYTLTPSSPMDYTFEPEYHTIVINGSDVSEINFVGDGYFISGQVKNENDSGISNVKIDLSNNDSTIFYVYADDQGSYKIAVPNGTYTLSPHDVRILPQYFFIPATVNVTINDEDLINVNFLAKE